MNAINPTVTAPAVRPAGVAVGPLRGRLATVALMVVVGVGLLVLAYMANRPAAGTGLTPVELGGVPRGPAPIVGLPAPDIVATTTDGDALQLSALQGSPVWLTFGATWCQPCRAEAPDIQAAYDAFKGRGVIVVEVFMTEDAATIVDYTDRVGLTFTKVPDPSSQLATDYRVLGIPSHFFIGRDGTLRQIKVGTLDRSTMDAILAELSG